MIFSKLVKFCLDLLFLLNDFNNQFSINYIIKKNWKMGCEQSNLSKKLSLDREETTSSEDEEIQLDYRKFVERQRGNILQLYHFSNVIHRNKQTIVRKVLERNSRISRICKILTTSSRSRLFDAFQEVQILKKLNHPNVVQIIQYFHQGNFLYIILQDIHGKTLLDFYYEEQHHSLSVILDILKQIIIAVKFCHHNGFAHGAINPQHILVLKIQKSNSFLVKIIGFSQAIKIGAPKKGVQSQLFGKDPLFIPPEQGNGDHIDKKDIWSCGIILLELLSGERKFPNFLENKQAIIKNIVERQNTSKQYKNVLINFLLNTLQILPQKRISAEQALNHQIFQLANNNIELNVDKRNVMNKLLKFRLENNLKSLFSIYASLSILSAEQKSEHLIEFYNLDKNKDGKIDFEELVEGMQNTFGFTEQVAIENVNKIFQKANKNRDKSIQFHEYIMATTFVSKEVLEKSLSKMFNQIDTNRDGLISQDELSHSMEGVKSSQLLRNHKKKSISFIEFKQLMLGIFQEMSDPKKQ